MKISIIALIFPDKLAFRKKLIIFAVINRKKVFNRIDKLGKVN